MPTVIELRKELLTRGIDRVYDRSLSRCLKSELEDFLRNSKLYNIRHLSHSQMDMYGKCALQYYWRYVRGLKIPPKWYMTLGSSADKSFNHNYTEKLRLGVDEPLDALLDVFHEDFSARTEETDWADEEPNSVEDRGIRMISAWRESLAPITYPKLVQHQGKIEFEDQPYVFTYVLDLVAEDEETGGDAIWDHKTSSKTPSQTDLDGDDQMTAYSLAYSLEQGRPESKLGYHAMVALKTKTDAKVLVTSRTIEQHKRYLRKVAAIYDSIKKGSFPPCSSRAWWCSENQCGYWDTCHESF